ncbi:MAG: hypothetical protein M9894_23235 [Planctomycetes bacterium]|nr:hypothetical protein [Planctomycetota bacterium]
MRDLALAARRALEVRLEVSRAEEAAARLAPAAVKPPLRPAARDPAAADAAARAVERALGGPAAAVDVVRAVRLALPAAPLPGAGRALHAAATAARAAGRQAEAAALVEEAWRLDPATPPPLDVVAVLLVEGSHLLETERAREGLPLVLHAVRAGRADPLPMRRVVRLLEQGVLDGWIAQHPADWAGRFLRAAALLEKLDALALRVREERTRRALEDLDALEAAAPALPPSVRASVDVLRVDAQAHRPGHLARVEAALTDGHPLRWKLCHRAAHHCDAQGDAEGLAVWSRRWADAVLERVARMARGEIDPDTHEFLDPSHQLRAAYVRLASGLLRTRRLDAARDLVAEVEGAALLSSHHRAEVLALLFHGLGRRAEAATAARVVLAGEPQHQRMQEVLRDAEAHLDEPR